MKHFDPKPKEKKGYCSITFLVHSGRGPEYDVLIPERF